MKKVRTTCMEKGIPDGQIIKPQPLDKTALFPVAARGKAFRGCTVAT